MNIKRLISIAGLIACAGCTHSLQLANGMVDWNYENKSFNGLNAERTNHVSKHGDNETRSTTIKVDTAGE